MSKASNASSSGPRATRAFVLLAFLTGVLLGVGGYTFLYAEGLSYMSDDPEVCINCHIMQSQYDSWQKSSHHAVAVCVDRHLPQLNLCLIRRI